MINTMPGSHGYFSQNCQTNEHRLEMVGHGPIFDFSDWTSSISNRKGATNLMVLTPITAIQNSESRKNRTDTTGLTVHEIWPSTGWCTGSVSRMWLNLCKGLLSMNHCIQYQTFAQVWLGDWRRQANRQIGSSDSQTDIDRHRYR